MVRNIGRIVLSLGVLIPLSSVLPRAARTADPDSKGAPASWHLECRLASYGQFQDAAWTHLPSINIHHVFISVPSKAETASVQKRLADSGLTPLVMRGQTDLGKPECVEELATQLETCRAMGVHYMFLSPKHSGADKETAYERLRRAGEIARRNDVIIALETHPDLGTNAQFHRETMLRVNHPNIRVNFDTGNITYYNDGADVVAELKKIVEFVATVELKDHGGRPMTWDFPALGRGKIDFPGVLKVLQDHDYRGPITVEVEGVEGQRWDENQTKQAIADSVSYLRKLAPFR